MNQISSSSDPNTLHASEFVQYCRSLCFRFCVPQTPTAKKMANFFKNVKFDENFEIRERCKGVHCVDLGESFPTSIFLQNLVSIQLKTTPGTSKFDFRITQRFNFPMVFSPSPPKIENACLPQGASLSPVVKAHISCVYISPGGTSRQYESSRGDQREEE